jgi:hypothetical protein
MSMNSASGHEVNVTGSHEAAEEPGSGCCYELEHDGGKDFSVQLNVMAHTTVRTEHAVVVTYAAVWKRSDFKA